MTSKKEVNLKGLFSDLQKKLLAGQELIRAHSTHEGSKGDASEFNWIKTLEDFLPSRYKVEKAFVVDCEGHASEQLDVVIFDRQYTPFILKQEGLIYVPAEGVYTVIEAKQSINKERIEYAMKKAESVRRLRRTSVTIHHAGGKFAAKEPFQIPAGFVTLSSEWKPALGSPFKKALLGGAESDAKRLDYGCVLDAGAFRVIDKGGKYKVDVCRKDASLMYFLLMLHHTLQQLGTVPAIDVLEYAKWLQ